MKMKFIAFAVAAALSLSAYGQQVLPVAGDEDHAAITETVAQRDARMEWWRDAKFGMFIHYGLYSGLAGEFKGVQGGSEWIQTNLGIDTETYAAEALPRFKPAPGCTEVWAELAKKAGCKYMVLTSKHHDGFALFDTPTSDYTSAVHHGRDLVKEFTDSARKQGMRVGLYHSVIDWHHPAYDNTICPDLCYPKNQAKMLKERGIPRDHATYQTYLHNQVRELMTKYGTIDILWWDYSQGAASGERGWKAPALMDMCRSINPGVIMNNRLYAFSGFDTSRDGVQLDLRCGDYTTPEKRIPEKGYPGIDWESCMTVGDKWGYNRYDLRYKTPPMVIRQLEECSAKGGNLLLNINPKADGSIPRPVVKVFTVVGKWMEVNGSAIYGSEPMYSVHLPDGWMCSRTGQDLNIFAPSLGITLETTVQVALPMGSIALPADLADLAELKVQVLGNEAVAVQAAIEDGNLVLSIPARAWAEAVEYMPVIRIFGVAR